jgi:hypothetical protein
MLRIMVGSVIALCLAVSGAAVAEPIAAPTEYQVKAAMLFNIAKFVEWPEGTFGSPAEPIIIGILGENPFESALDAARDRKVGGRKIQLRHFTSVEDVTGCHILFISRSEKRNLSAILRVLRETTVLLVGDTEEYAQQGGMINFVLQNETVTLEINVDALNRVGIKINSRLLNIARIVRSGRREGEH